MRRFDTSLIAQRRIERVVVLAIVLLAWAMRVISLETLPPGVDRDTASNGVVALQILFEGARPFFIAHMGAPQPLIVYLQAAAIFFAGAHIFTLRFVTAAIGTLTIPALYALGRSLRFKPSFAMVAALGLAISLDHIHLSRLGLRAIFIPLCVVLLLFMLSRALDRGRMRYWTALGAVLAGSMYTYLAALFLPLLLIVLVGHQLIFSRKQIQWRWKNGLAFLGAALIVLLPLIVFAARYPDATFARADSVSLLRNPNYPQVGIAGVVAEKLLSQAKMFGIEWLGQYNPLSQPLLDPFWFVLFVIGAIAALFQFRSRKGGWLILALVVILLPDLFGGNELYPHELRTSGVIPIAFLLCALGVATILEHVPIDGRKLAWATIVVLMLWSGWHTYDLYFNQLAWMGRTVAQPLYNQTETTEGRWLAESKGPVLVPLNEFARQPVRYLAGQRAPTLKSALGDEGTIRPNLLPKATMLLMPAHPGNSRTEGKIYTNDPAMYVLLSGDNAYILPPLKPEAVAALDAKLKSSPFTPVAEPTGKVAARAYSLGDTVPYLQFDVPTETNDAVRFGDRADLLAYELSDKRAMPGQTIDLTLVWRVLNRTADNDVIFIHLITAQNEAAAVFDIVPELGAYPTWVWKPGEVIITHHPLKIPQRLKPGTYAIEFGLYDTLNGERVDRIDETGERLDDRLILDKVKVAPSTPTHFKPSHLQTAQFGGQARLLGYDLQAGEDNHSQHLTLYWQGLAEMARDYTVFVHVLDASGNIIAQADHQPQVGNNPTSSWEPGEEIRDTVDLALPLSAPTGDFRIEIGMYDLVSGERLGRNDANSTPPGDSVVLDSPILLR